jgi:hypothetical protein
MAELNAGLSIGEELRCMRLRARVGQLTRVLAILRRRELTAGADGSERLGLRRAIADFDVELTRAHAELQRSGVHVGGPSPGRC